MLQEMKIRNFAVIEEASCSFENGLSILTGETGAGKSIVIDALELALGARASSNLIRRGKEKAIIEALFDIQNIKAIRGKLSELGLEVNDDELLVMREINHNGKSICRVNGQLVTISMLKEIGRYLVDIHGQHEHQSLFSKPYHLSLLDRFGKIDLSKLEGWVHQYDQLEKELEKLGGSKQEQARYIDLLQYQVREIADVNPLIGEDERLIAERQVLSHAEKLDHAVGKAYGQLQEGEENERSILERLGDVIGCLENVGDYDSRVLSFIERIQEAAIQLEEVSRDLRYYRENVEGDSERLEYVENRLDALNNLKRKYGDSIEEIQAYRQKAEGELDGFLHNEERRRSLEEKIQQIENEYYFEARLVGEKRRAIASQLEQLVINELSQLGMEKACFKVYIESGKEIISLKGNDEVEFLFSANPGEPLKPLLKVASGGEIARMMLALKVIFAQNDTIPTLVFDEIDVGISGRIAQVVAEKMAVISRFCQVISVTHLPQTASMADVHYRVTKTVKGEQTFVFINPLSGKERVKELAKMLGGAEVTETTLNHSQEMLMMAEGIKKKITT